MYKCYTMDIAFLRDPAIFRKSYQQISRERQKKVDSCRLEQSKRQALGAGMLLARAFQEHGVSVDHQIEYGKQGKPRLAGIRNLWFNLSHAEEKVICVIADHPIGCDVEKIKPARVKVGRRAFTETEYIRLISLEDPVEQDVFFARIWTRKESVSKAFGCGLQVPFDEIAVWPETNTEELKMLMKDYLQEAIDDFNCRFEEYQEDDYQFCICHVIQADRSV